jgi:hypothetical protein
MLTDMQIPFEIAMKNHLVAFRTFAPELFRNVRLLDQRAKLWTNEIG